MPRLKSYNETTSQWEAVVVGGQGPTGPAGGIGPTGPTGESGLPTGAISQFAGSTAPTGYVLCTGQSLSTTTFAGLFAVIGYTYGGSGANFSVPNLQGRAPVGRDSTQTEFDLLGETGGAKTHTLTTAEMPSHTHTQNSHNHTQNPHNHRVGPLTGNGGGTAHGSFFSSSMANDFITENTTATNQATTATNQNTGGGGAHNNLQPYIVLNYIIKT